ncbi:MAG: RNA polymerase sigma factor [Planctomycetes bacterium]|nr:RNA polymerase sigma factor [Planctomycetota bacterium]
MDLVIGQQANKAAAQEPSGLLAHLRARDLAALDRLTLDYGGALSRAAYLLIGDAHLAADVVQETLIAAWDGAGRTNERTELRPWLFGILFNLGRKQLRSFTRRRRREETASLRAASVSERSDGEDDRIEQLRHALQQLDEDERQLIVLRFEQDFSVAQAAQALGVPEGTVKSRTFSAIEKLRRLMKPG